MPEIDEIRMGFEIGYAPRHRYIWHACVDCGKRRWVVWKQKEAKPRSERCPSCGLRHINRTGDRSPSWNGGLVGTKDGYVWVWVASNDFFHPMANTHGYVLEHRLIMAKSLNRCLLPWEIVHHRDGIKDHNDLINLQLISGKRYHVVDAAVKRYIKKLEREINLLRLENEHLKGGDKTYQRNGRASISESSQFDRRGNKRNGRGGNIAEPLSAGRIN